MWTQPFDEYTKLHENIPIKDYANETRISFNMEHLFFLFICYCINMLFIAR